MAVTTKDFGGGATLYRLENKNGMTVEIADLGGALISVRVPDREGNFADVTLGYADYKGCRMHKGYLGLLVGRCCNRMAKGRFTLNGVDYQLACNDGGKNHLHGGNSGFDQKLWNVKVLEQDGSQSLELFAVSKDGEEGYPGRLEVHVTYTLDDENALSIKYDAVSDADTLCNLTNHAYWNMAGHDAGSVLGQELRLYADYFNETDDESIPTGRVLPVAGTPMDFTKSHQIGDEIAADYQPLIYGCGYDHNWVLRDGTGLRPAAELYDPASGRLLTVETTSPCIQVYTGNKLDGALSNKDGVKYARHGGIALETQFAPDAVNHPAWASPVLRKGERFAHETVFRFTTR